MKYRYFLVSLLILLTQNVFSQDCVTAPPLPPVLRSVSVQPETGNTVFTWTSSPSSGIAAYILYSYRNGDATAIDTIRDPAATTYILSSTATKYFSVSYVIASMRLPRCTSIFSNVLNTVFNQAVIDTCLKKITINWNSYSSSPLRVTDYSVLMSVNGSAYNEIQRILPPTTGFVMADYVINADYCFVVRANLGNGAFSSSNKSCVLTKMKKPPNWINADEATVSEEGKIVLSFTIDPLSEIRQFSLEEKENDGNFREILKTTSQNGTVEYIDNQAKTNIINFYRLSAINSCNLPVTVSNLAANIVLSAKNSGNDIQFSWNPCDNWLGKVSDYRLFVNTGRGFEEKAVIPASDTNYVMDYRQIMYDVSSNEVCYYIEASEIANPYGIAGKTRSAEICTSPSEIITVPNVFTPDNDLHNDLFKPVLSFTPSAYRLIISDRTGAVLFESRDFLEAWDGTHNGSPLAQGVYIWSLRCTNPSGKIISKTGTVTIIKKR